MTENEFRKQMKELGWKENDIEDYIKMYKMQLNDGIDIPLEAYLLLHPEISRYPSKGYTD
ncbi:MAG: hypothetical protein K2O42_09385 [Oscillospiraceae bacterium]|nr:hypothetical protein [Oscillospiraceae bacterium]